MQKYRLLWIAVVVVLVLLVFPSPAYAYIDPGTTGSIFAILAPFIALFLAFLGFLLRPLRRFLASIVTKLRRGSRDGLPPDDEQAVLDEPPDEEESQEGTGE